MLEAMLWSILATLKEYNPHSDYQTRAVDPSRMSKYWAPVDTESTVVKRVKGQKAIKVDSKKVRIDLVKSWLKSESLPNELDVKFGAKSEPIKSYFLQGRLQIGQDAPTKKDDLADCLLQAAGVTAWEANRRQILDMSTDEIETLCKDADHTP
jgi:hypothetical protein